MRSWRKSETSNESAGAPFVGVLRVELGIEWARSLKDRRQIVRSLLDHLRAKWNVSVLDLGPDAVWTHASVAAAFIAESHAAACAKLDALEEHILHLAEEGDFVVRDASREVAGYDELSNRTGQ